MNQHSSSHPGKRKSLTTKAVGLCLSNAMKACMLSDAAQLTVKVAGAEAADLYS